MAFPTVAPSGYAWLEELEEVPRLVLNDKAMIVAVAKLIGALPVSAEMFPTPRLTSRPGSATPWPTA
jgi:hypothetical protein